MDVGRVGIDGQGCAQLAQGVYSGRLDMFTEKKLVIPERTIEVEDEDVDIPRIEQDGFASGAAAFTYAFTEDDLGHQKLVLYILSPDLLAIPLEDRQMEQLNILNRLDDDTYAGQVRPRFE